MKHNPPRKTFVFQQWYDEFEPNSQTLHVSVHTTYPANFINTTDMVQQI